MYISSLKDAHRVFGATQDWFFTVPATVLEGAIQSAGSVPEIVQHDAKSWPETFEGVEILARKTLDWFNDAGPIICLEMSRAAGPTPTPGLEACLDIRGTCLPFYIQEYGMVTAVPHDAPGAENGFHSLGNAAICGIAVSAFDRPISVEMLYDSADDWRSLGEPVGRMASYRVCVLDGNIIHPPAWPSTLLKHMREQEEEWALGM